MIISRLLAPVHSLGPGNRVCLWTQGCSKQCPGCISKELQPSGKKETDEHMLSEAMIRAADISKSQGLTISGGDPFEQADALLRLLKLVRNRFSDILVYSGWTLKEILDGKAGSSGVECLDFIDILIDGRYIEKLNTPDCVLRGSSNQEIHFFNKKVEPEYIKYMENGRIIEPFFEDNKIIITGILDRG